MENSWLEILRGFLPLICLIAGFVIGLYAGKDKE